MDFADYGDFATFLHIHATFPRFSAIVFMGEKEERMTNFGNGTRKRDSELVGSVRGAWNHGDRQRFRIYCESFSRISYCAQHNFASGNSGPSSKFRGDRRRHGLLRVIIDHVVGNRKPSSLRSKERKEFAATTTMRLNSHAQQFGGAAPGRRVFGTTPRMPIGAVGNPHFEDSMHPKEAPDAKTHHFLGEVQKYDKL